MQAELIAGETALDWATGEVLAVHPAAAMFPMLAPEELADLTAHIREQGLLQAVVLDGTRQLIDGRNRLAACAAAEVVPHYVTLSPDIDAVAYVLGLNVQRRHLNQGQRAMAVVLAAERFNVETLRQGEARALAESVGANKARISQASLIARYAPDLGPLVLAGAEFLHVAYKRAQEAEAEAEERDRRAERAASDLLRLQSEHPDLAALVAEERLPLADAIALADKREQEARDRRRRMTGRFAEAAVTLWTCIFETPEAFLEQWDAEANPWDARRNAAGAPLAHLWTGDGLHQLAARLEQLADAVDANGGGL